MSELSIDELQTETGELLPEREALGTIIIGNIGAAVAIQAQTDGRAGQRDRAAEVVRRVGDDRAVGEGRIAIVVDGAAIVGYVPVKPGEPASSWSMVKGQIQ